MATFNAPVVPHFLAGTGPAETDMDTLVYQTMSFLQNRIVARLSQVTTATTLPSSAAVTVIGFDNVIEDPYSGWSAGSHERGPPSGYSGWYQVTLTVRTAAVSALVDLHAALIVQPAATTFSLNTVQGAGSGTSGVCATWTVYLIGGEESVQGAASVLNSAGNVSTSLTAGQNSTMEIVYLTQN